MYECAPLKIKVIANTEGSMHKMFSAALCIRESEICNVNNEVTLDVLAEFVQRLKSECVQFWVMPMLHC